MPYKNKGTYIKMIKKYLKCWLIFYACLSSNLYWIIYEYKKTVIISWIWLHNLYGPDKVSISITSNHHAKC